MKFVHRARPGGGVPGVAGEVGRARRSRDEDPRRRLRHGARPHATARRSTTGRSRSGGREDPLRRHLRGAVAAAARALGRRGAEARRRDQGTFGVIRRPNGKLQVTHNGLPVYTYVHEGPGEVRCDNVNGWFVVRL